MTGATRKAVIGIVGYSCADILTRCIAGCDAMDFPDFEIHICENGGSAAYEELLAALGTACAEKPADMPSAPALSHVLRTASGRTRGGRRLVVHEADDNLGYSGGLNVVLNGIAADPDWTSFWILNPDAVPDPDALRELDAYLLRGGYGAVGARLVFSASGTIQQYGGRWRWWLGRGYNVGYGEPADKPADVAAIEAEINYISGACLYADRAFVEEVGAMEERYFLFSEEVDWCLRRGSRKLGYCHSAVILHEHGATIGSSRKMNARSAFSIYLLERSGVLLTRKFRPALLPLVAMTSGLYTLRYLRHGGWPQFRAAFGGWAAGVLGETGHPPRFARKKTD